MDISITSATIATLISALTSAIVSLLILRTNKQKSIDDQLDAILKIAIQYPYLESDSFTETWKCDFDRSDERYLCYDVYCTLLFNYLSRVALYYKFNHGKVEKYIAVKEWIRLHGKYWKNPTSSYENVDGYSKQFIAFVANYLN